VARLGDAVQACTDAWQGTQITTAEVVVKDSVPTLMLTSGSALKGLLLDLLQV
jgi:hypothetical protein